MPRRKLLRRFDPTYGVSMVAVEIEANILQREVENMEVQSNSDVETRLNTVREKSKQCWDHLCLLTAGLSDRERRIINAFLFRDFYHILELYLCHVRTNHPEVSAPSTPPVKPKKQSDEFNEWLFEP
jgi:hypothetical protein